MPCFHPLKGYRANSVNPSGKRSIVFNKNEGFVDLPVQLPCGQCIGCRLRRSVEWAVRMTHEAQLHEYTSFLTLTYSDEHLPKDKSLKKEHFQDFMKRIRARVSYDYENKKDTPLLTNPAKPVRYFHCGEYGEKFARPHYHAAMFNLQFADLEAIGENNGSTYHTSPSLRELWGKGHVVIGELNFQSAAYVARYITKKITGERASWYYDYVDEDTGEVHHLQPEYTTMSRRPGIGKEWFDSYKDDVFPGDFVVINGKKFPTPKFYTTQLELAYPSDHAKLRGKRMVGAEKKKEENSQPRLLIKEEVQIYRLELLKRSYENG